MKRLYCATREVISVSAGIARCCKRSIPEVDAPPAGLRAEAPRCEDRNVPLDEMSVNVDLEHQRQPEDRHGKKPKKLKASPPVVGEIGYWRMATRHHPIATTTNSARIRREGRAGACRGDALKASQIFVPAGGAASRIVFVTASLIQ